MAEVGASGRASVVVPYPHSPDAHQERNAERLGEGAVIVPQAELGDAVAARIATLLGTSGREERHHRAAAAAGSVPRDAGARIAAEVLELAKVAPVD